MVGFTLDGSVQRAEKMLRRMVDPEMVDADKAIPMTLLQHCEAVAFITILKAGLFMIGGNVGGGCIIAKVPDPSSPTGYRWSGPSALVCGGLGGGFIFGGEKVDSVVILNTKSAVRAFMGKGNVTFGGSLAIAAGPVGREMDGHVGVSDTKELLAAYSYSQSKGAIIAATLEGAVCTPKESDNFKYYSNTDATVENVLTGKVPAPAKAQGMIDKLEAIIRKKDKVEAVEKQNIGQSGRELLKQSLSGNFGAKSDLPDGWQELKTPDGKLYYFNSKTNVTQWEKPARAAPPAPPVPSRPPESVAIALYDYDASRSDELSFKKGAKIIVLEKKSPDWWEGKLDNGTVGLIPSNYVKTT